MTEEIANLKKQIELRKDLRAQLRNIDLKKHSSINNSNTAYSFITDVRIGKALENFSAPVKNYKKRELYSNIEQYIYGDNHDKVFILYGLRRTGKTTLIRQIIYNMNGENYNKDIFSSKNSTDEYVNTAIARNIQHSLKNYQHEGHFRSLKELYDNNELTNVINRIVEDMNHEFTIKVLTNDFKSHDFGSAKDIIRKDKKNPTDILDDVDEKVLTENLMKLLEILNKQNQKIRDIHRTEIKEYFDLLDLTCDIPLVDMNDLNRQKVNTVFSQPGLRYSQAESLIKTLLMDEVFKNINAVERKRITDRILDDINGRMLEEIVQLETKKAKQNKEVFKLQFAVGEFDMVVYDPENICCEIYEIKHSKEQNPFQYRHLVSQDNCSQTEFRYGKIQKKIVLYRGENCILENGIEYKNVEEYLCEL